MKTLICPHWSPGHVGGEDDTFMRELKPKVIKLFFSGDSIPRLDVALEAATDLVILRHHPISENGEQRGIRDRQHALDMAKAHANTWKSLLTNIPKEKIAVEGLNEIHVWPWGDELPENASAYYAELGRLLYLQGIRVVYGNIGVGWPENGEPTMPPNSPPIWKPFIEMAEAIDKYNGYLGVHEYFFVNGPKDPWIQDGKKFGGWGWWAGRFKVFPWNLPIIITECGIDAHVMKQEYFGWHGLNSPRDETYMQQLIDYEMQCILDGRVVALTPFTHDFYDRDWATYDTRVQPFMNMWLSHARDMEANNYTLPAEWPLPAWSSTPWTPSTTPVPPTPIPSSTWDTVVAKWNTLVAKYATTYDLSPQVVHTIIILESGGDETAVNTDSQATGLMQVIPLTGRPTQVELLNPDTNIKWGCKILRDDLNAQGTLEKALCAYGGVANANPLSETGQAYLKLFYSRWRAAWPKLTPPITIPVPVTVDQRDIIAARWFAEEAVRKIEAGEYVTARALLLGQTIESIYKVAGDRD